MHYLLTPAIVIESSDNTYMFPCFAIFELFGHMLSLTTPDPERHLLEAVVAAFTGICDAFDLSTCGLVLYYILCWYPVGLVLHSFVSYLGTTNGCVVPLS